ncbi:MAG: amidohydrolase family protein [Planctomycetota bacterium]|jgi:predicted TIM-barrel fold metal-dependent hydrolase|nr:amidohydrolase family protein [Planctomycetota bacterium]
MLIDAHNHPNWHGFNAERILQNMEEHNIDQMWLFSWEVPEDEYSPSYHRVLPPTGLGIPLEDVLSVGREAPDKFVLGYIPHPKRPDAIDRLKAAVEIYGIRVASELKVRVTFDDPDAIRLYQFCGEQKLPITIHLDYPLDHGGTYPRPNYWYGGSLDSFERALKECPETIFIGHAPGFWAHISGDDKALTTSYPSGKVLPGGRIQKLFRKYKNLYADLSAGSGLKALMRNKEYGRKFLIQFQDRLLFGRDCFDSRLMDFLLKAKLPQKAFDKITHQNAQRLLA